MLIIPSPINLLTRINEEILAARRQGFQAQLTLPDLRHLAWISVNEIGPLPVDQQELPGSTQFTR